jgi:hypothetical protein
MSKKHSPPPPDYAALAKQQGQDSRNTAEFNAQLNRVNQYTPDGSLVWNSTIGPDGKEIWSQTTSLSPQQQALYDGQNKLSQQYLNTAQNAVDRVSQTLGTGLDISNLPGQRYVGSGPQMSTVGSGPQFASFSAPAFDQKFLSGPDVGPISPSSITRSFDTSGVRALPGNIDDTSRRRVEEAIMSRINPQYQQDEQALRTRLLNSGIEVGTDAYNREMNNFSQRLNDARMQAVLAGGQEESRQVGLQAGLQGQEFNQAYQRGKFAQDADSQMAQLSQQAAIANAQNEMSKYGLQLGAQNQMFQQGLAGANFNNNWGQQGFQNSLTAAGFNNNAQQQAFANDLNAAGFNNSARQSDIQLQAYLRQLPLNEANALRTGGQVQGPQFGSYYTGASAQTAPLLDAGIAQGNYNLQAAQQNQSGFNSFLGGLANLGSAYLGSPSGSQALTSLFGLKPSDPRLKSDIVRVGTHKLGIGIYEYTIFGERQRGVMSTEVRKVMPDAVIVGEDGFDRVDYSKIGGI